MVRLTDRNHALSIIVQVLKHHLTQRIHFTSTPDPKRTYALLANTRSSIPLIIPHALLLSTQKTPLLFQPTKQAPHFPHDLAIARPVRLVLANHESEVEHEFIAAVLALADAHGVPDDAVVVGAEGDQAIAELLGGDEIRGDRGEGEQRLGQRGRRV